MTSSDSNDQTQINKKFIKLSVQDTGIGIESNNIERIFEPFYSSKPQGRTGTGLSLFIVKGTMEDIGEYVEVESKLKIGTTFSLIFATTLDITIHEMPISIYELMGQNNKILVVDDEELQREIGTVMLIKLNHSPHTVSSGEEAI